MRLTGILCGAVLMLLLPACAAKKRVNDPPPRATLEDVNIGAKLPNLPFDHSAVYGREPLE